MRLLGLALMAWCSATMWAQGPPIPPIREFFPPDVKQYLSLTDDQVRRIQTLNAELGQFQWLKSARQVQVQIEIAQETRRESLDAMALGMRYLELEVIRREMERERTRVVAAVQALLTETQKVKVAALRQVIGDYPTACAGVAVNVVPAPVVAPGNRPGFAEPATLEDRFSRTTGLLGLLPAMCGGAVPTTVVRVGDFSGQQP